MSESEFQLFLSGLLVAVSAFAGMFFVRFWRDTRDRLFLAFATAFFLLSLNWTLLAIFVHSNETRPLFYAIRLLAFVVILLGIWDKNRSAAE